MHRLHTASNQPSSRKIFRVIVLSILTTLFVINDVRLILATYEKNSPPIFLLVALYVISFLSFVFLLSHRIKLIRTLAQILLFSSIYTDVLYIILGSYPFSYPDAINLFNNPEYASGAFMTFKNAFLLAFVGTGILYAFVQPAFKKVNIKQVFAPLFLFIILQLCLYVYSKFHPGIHDFFPSVYRFSGNLLTANRFRPEEKWKRAEVAEQPGSRIVKHIFLVVDESVTGNALSINGFTIATTPFLKSNHEKFINFGAATSFTNFSAGTNLSLMSGMRPKELPDKAYVSFSKPSIFQYAKKAGYQTYWLDAQIKGEKLQNYITSQDLLFIDSLFQPGVIYPASTNYSLDSMLAEKIGNIASSEMPSFVYVNKAGAHWPYQINFPPDSLNQEFSVLESKKIRNASAYFNSLYWNVDKFWEILMKKLEHSSNVLILYTSDHGENFTSPLFEMKHASIYETDIVEGIVPLFILDRSNFFPEDFVPAINKYTHQYIFPTLLNAMGYNEDFIQNQYGRTLLMPPYPQPRWFLTGDLFGRGKNHHVYVDEY